ncbi:MAG: NUDIX domain-containing protein [Patescibacteria group bacterium]
MRIIQKVALAVFKDKKIMLVRSSRKDEIFYSLGGKIKMGESDLECLRREVFEEVGCAIEEGSLKFLHEFEGPAHGTKGRLNIRMYAGRLIGEPKVSSEVFEIGYFDTNSPKKNLSEIAQTIIFPWLKERGYIN